MQTTNLPIVASFAGLRLVARRKTARELKTIHLSLWLALSRGDWAKAAVFDAFLVMTKQDAVSYGAIGKGRSQHEPGG